MKITDEVKDLLKSSEKKSEFIRLRKLLEEKKAKGIILPRRSVVPNLQDAEKYSRSIFFGNGES